MRYALFDCGTTAKNQTWLPGEPTAQRIGWCQFVYSGFSGRLIPISFAQSILIPDFQGPAGGRIFVPDSVTYSLTEVSEPAGGFTLNNLSGPLNYTLAEPTNWFPPISGAHQGGTSELHQNCNIPYATLAGVLKTDVGSNPQALADATAQYSNWSALMALLSFATDIAQQTCMYNASETTEEFTTLTGSTLCVPGAGVPRSAQIDCFTYPIDAGSNFGKTGALMLGHYAWYYDGYYGPIHYLNSAQSFSVPELPSATGLYLLLKAGVKANVTLGVNEYTTTSTITSLGTINFLANFLSGLQLPP